MVGLCGAEQVFWVVEVLGPLCEVVVGEWWAGRSGFVGVGGGLVVDAACEKLVGDRRLDGLGGPYSAFWAVYPVGPFGSGGLVAESDLVGVGEDAGLVAVFAANFHTPSEHA